MPSKCKEIKKYFNGGHKIYDCELLQLNEQRGVLKYILQEKHLVDDIVLKPQDITYAFYWPELPFNLYKWEDKTGVQKGNYFNIADQVKLDQDVFQWRDLRLDVLVPQGDSKPILLDEDEIKNIEGRIKEYILSSKKYILQNFTHIIQKTDRIINQLKAI